METILLNPEIEDEGINKMPTFINSVIDIYKNKTEHDLEEIYALEKELGIGNFSSKD